MNGSDPLIENYRLLAAAVVAQAARDYVALYGTDCFEEWSLERFFNSSQFAMYTNGAIDGDYLIKHLREITRRRQEEKRKHVGRGRPRRDYIEMEGEDKR